MRPAPPLPTPPHHPRRPRRGFTMLEILIVIGIIILLVSIGVVAFSALDQSPKVTKTTLGNLHAMLAEFQAMTDLRDQPQNVHRGTGQQSTTGPNPASLWREPAVVTSGDEDGRVAGGTPGRFRWSAVANTQLVYQFLARLPNNKKVMTALPSKQVMGVADATDRGRLLGPSGNNTAIDPPLVLDAWNNPIVFVGSDGLVNVSLESQFKDVPPNRPELRITSAGVFTIRDPLPTNRRPFFASAGPDGEFKTGDDNIYSFDQ